MALHWTADDFRCSLRSHFANNCRSWYETLSVPLSLVRTFRFSSNQRADQILGFPVLICGMIPFRVYFVPRWFSEHEISVMDELTANSKVVLASLGGAPTLIGTGGLERRYSEYREGVPRQRVGSIHR